MKGKLIKNQICFTPNTFQEVATSKEKHYFYAVLGNWLLPPIPC
jgi:hypothetical protein